MRNRWLLTTAVVLLALLVTLLPWRAVGTAAQMGATTPLDQLSGDDFDRAFLLQMNMHHAMAVMMARPAAAQSAHQETKDLAQTIIDDQMREIVLMRSWAKSWYGLDVPDPVAAMDQMQGGAMGDHSGHGMMGQGGVMGQVSGMGMMQDMSMMNDLWKLSPQRLEVAFMTLMIPHHQSAIDMAMLVPDRASHQELKDLAQAIIQGQGDEIGKMNGWLASWYGL